MPTIHHENLRAAVHAVCVAAGSVGDEPTIVADNLVHANLTGHDSHGVGMLPRYIKALQEGELQPNAKIDLLADMGSMLVVDGKAGYGQSIGRQAMALAIERAREHGVCIMAVRRSFHLCRIGAWGEQCARAGLVSIHYVNVVGHPGLVAPWRGSDARFATNPYCITMPATGANPATQLDMATSIVAHGKVRVAKNKGERMAPGVLINNRGQPTTDPNVMFEQPMGAILPFAEHKGYGMALMSELMAGVLSGGRTCRPETNHEQDTILNNMLSIVFDPTRLVDSGFYNAEMDATIAHVKGSPPADPALPVLVPGDPERATHAERTAHGVPVDDETWRELETAAISVGLKVTDFRRMAGVN